MASSSRPFQSQTLSRLLAGYRQMAHGAEHLLRQGRTALIWGIQVMAFPLYVAFQNLRTAVHSLPAAPTWQPWNPQIPRILPQPVPLASNTSDTPIRALLALIQPQRGALATLATPMALWRRRSQTKAVIAAGQGPMVPLKTPVVGVASLLATRQIVLITLNNIAIEGLTALERDHIQRTITHLLAESAVWEPDRISGERDLVVAGPLSVMPPTSGPREMTPYRRPSGTGMMATDRRPGALSRGDGEAWEAVWEEFWAEGTGDRVSFAPGQGHPLNGASPDPKALPGNDAIEAHVSGVDYVDHPLVMVLRGLDRLLHWVETWLQRVWRWLRGYR